jgi:hypothetical protein
MDLSKFKNGYTTPLVVLFIIMFVSIPIIYWSFFSKSESVAEVKGVTRVAEVDNAGLNLAINSIGGTWDMYTYLCDDPEQCLDTVSSGKRISVSSGGKVENYLLKLPFDESWKKQKYLKIYIKAGWGSQNRTFKASNISQNSNVKVETIDSETNALNVLLVPTEVLETTKEIIGSFSDE